MGALPQFSVLFQFFFQKSPTGGTIYEYIGKYKEIEGQIAHDFFFYVMGTSKKKLMGAQWAQRPWNKKNKNGRFKKKNDGQRPFFGSPIFSRPWSYNPYFGTESWNAQQRRP